MNFWNRQLIGSDKNIGQRNMAWNMAGSMIYALAGIFLGVAVTRILGADMGGIFFFAFSTFGQQMFIVSYFGIRPIQITDTGNKNSFGDYRRLRFATCGAAVAVSLFYAFLFVADPLKRCVVLLMVLYKVLDGFADCWDSEFQRNGRLYLTGKSNAGRTVLSCGLFLLVLFFTKDLILSCVAAVLGQFAGFLLFCLSPVRELSGIDYRVSANGFRELFSEGKWLFLSAFLDLYIFAASKYAVNSFLTDADNSYYSTIFIPTSAINLMANFVIRPVLTSLSDDWNSKNREAFRKTVFRITGIILVLTGLGVAAAFLFGIPVLSAILGKEAGAHLSPYTGALMTVILGGGFYAVLNLMYYVLVILKEEKYMFVIYGAGCLIAWAVSRFMVRQYGINGAAGSYLILMILIAGLFALRAAWKFKRTLRKEET